MQKITCFIIVIVLRKLFNPFMSLALKYDKVQLNFEHNRDKE